MNPKIVGIVLGGVIGAVLLWCGVSKAFLLGLCVLGGWLMGKLIAGEIDLIDVYERFLAARGRGRHR